MAQKKVPKKYKKYAEDVVSGKIKACKNIQLACQKYLDFFDKYYFDVDKIQKIENFFTHMKHFEGEFNKKSFTLLPWQLWVICAIFGFYQQNDHSKRVTRNVFLLISRKNGKDIDLNTLIPTPDGFRFMRDIHTGDYVFDKDGNPTKVTYESPVYTDHECYKMMFQNGESIIAGAGHRWFVKSNIKNFEGVKTTEELFADGFVRERNDKKGVEYFWRVPKAKAVKYPKKELPIDPYVLGLWLGDGDANCSRFSVPEDKVELYDSVKEIYGEPHIYVDKRRQKPLYEYRFQGLSEQLKENNLLNNKHIPKEYMFASVEQRLALLQGLMDTDGSINGNHGQCEISQVRFLLSSQIVELLRSLGFITSDVLKTPSINGKECNTVHRITFHADKTFSPFRLKRKYDRLPDELNERSNWNSIINIERCETVHTKCIQVDNPEHLYLAGRCYTVTHNTALSAAIMLANMMCDAEPGYEGYLVANNTQQAKIAFKFITGFARSLDPNHKHIRVYRDYITYDRTHSMIRVLSSDSMGNDGYNPSSFICDEFAASKTYDSYNILKSGMTMRKNPLSITISSAGFLLDTYPCYESCKVGERCLLGEFEDDHTFYALYQLDEGDCFHDEGVWVKACPSYPVIALKDYMEERITEAEQNTAKMTDVLTKNFNVWCTAQNTWLESKYLRENHIDVDLSKLEQELCYIGVDLSATRDLTAMTVMFPPNPYRDYYPDKYLFKNFTWIPHSAMQHSRNKNVYQWFVDSGWAEVTPGNSVDYSAIELKIKQMSLHFMIAKISYDQWQAALFTLHMISDGFPMQPYGQGLGSFNRPTKTFEILVINKQCGFDCNQMILWMFSHCELLQDHMENVKPTKAAENPLNKIDNIISMLESLGGYLLDNMPTDMTVQQIPLNEVMSGII